MVRMAAAVTFFLVAFVFLGRTALGASLEGLPFVPLDGERIGITGLPADTMVQYTLTDYTGDRVVRGEILADAEGNGPLGENPGPGFWELMLVKSRERLRFHVGAYQRGEPDPFFCVDAGLSWLVEPEHRGVHLELIRRAGWAISRERALWGAIQPAPESWNWEGDRQYDTLRQAYKKAGVPILEVHHATPDWLKGDPKDVFPGDMIQTYRSWLRMAQQWGGNWSGLETWNEPDWKPFSNDMPADRYVPHAKAMARVRQDSGHDFLLGGGVFTFICPPGYRDAAARNGLLDCSDFVSFHFYSQPAGMAESVADYRAWLREFGHPDMPLWITESGDAWPAHDGPPTREEDAGVALDIAAKAIEARACGVARYFPFCLPHYVEGSSQFGMVDAQGYPNRSFSAYAHVADVLAGSTYQGALNPLPKGLTTARVFRLRDGGAVVTLYAEAPEAGRTVSLPFAVDRVAGIDGRPLRPGPEGRIPVPDGLAFCFAPWERAAAHFVEDRAYELLALARPTKAEGAAAPFLLQPTFPLDEVRCTPLGYVLPPGRTDAFPLTVRVCNLGDAPGEAKVSLRDAEARQDAANPWAPHTVSLGAREAKEVSWLLDMESPVWREGRCRLEVVAESEGKRDRLDMTFSRQMGLDEMREAFPAAKAAALPTEVTPSMAEGGHMEVRMEEGAWTLEARFAEGSRWVFPRMTLPEGTAFADLDGVFFEARFAGDGAAHLILWEEGDAHGFFNAPTFVPPDGEWHAVHLPFDSFVQLPSHPKSGGGLELEKVDRYSLGFSSHGEEGVLQLRGFHLIPKANIEVD